MKRIIQQLAAIAAFLSLGAQALAAAPQQKAIVVVDQTGRELPVVSWDMPAQPIPEPGSLALVLFGATAFLSRRWRRTPQVGAALAVCAVAFFGFTSQTAHAKLGGFETADGYSTPFTHDVWMYDAGQTGAPFTPPFYNTGRWAELFGSGNAAGDSQYMSQHGFGSGGANVAPFALAVRCLSPSTDGSYNQQVRYSIGADDTGVSPSTPVFSALVEFDICPGVSVIPSTGFMDTVFNNVKIFSMSFGGTNAAPGVTMGFTDPDPANSSKPRIVYDNGGTTVTQPFLWSGHFDHVSMLMNMITGKYDLSVTTDANLTTTQFDAGNIPQVIVTGASFTNPFSLLDNMYLRTHTDPGNGVATAGLEKSFLDNFSFQVVVPEPSSALGLLAVGLVGLLRRRRK